jgi:hypothetical protein
MTDDFTIKSKTHPLIAGLPEHLKDPRNYEKVQRAVLEAFAGKHSHGEITEWAGCADCQKRFAERRHVLKSFGFKNAAQYMAWRAIHEAIKERMPLVDWTKQ